ncbi:MAG TPA: NUDIX domain-containing protein [Candidatus Paceibacterota bacterium]|nr:NUDIX domain-containing protein [Candidatus Paceibacterota bacterium]
MMAMMPPGAFAFVRDQGGFLLVRDKDRGGKPIEQQKWGLPGGQMCPDETPEEACAREGREETGLELKPLRLIGQFFLVKSSGLVYLCECRVVGGTLLKETEETSDADFFGLANLPRELMFPAQLKLLLWGLVPTNGRPHNMPLLFPRPEQLNGYKVKHLLPGDEQ